MMESVTSIPLLFELINSLVTDEVLFTLKQSGKIYITLVQKGFCFLPTVNSFAFSNSRFPFNFKLL